MGSYYQLPNRCGSFGLCTIPYKKKSAEHAHLKIYGQPIKIWIAIIYIGITVDAILIMAISLGWTEG
jgi:hypothetical protein